MKKHQEPIKSLFDRLRKDKSIIYEYTGKSIIVYLESVSDYNLQHLQRYCFEHRLYFDVKAEKNKLIINIQNE